MKLSSLLIFCVLFASCDFFSPTKKEHQQLIDTVVNFSKVDASPSFIECKDKIDVERLQCFRATMHQKISENLANHKIKIKDSINEVIKVYLSINSKGNVSLKEVVYSGMVKIQIPTIDSLLKVSVDELPKISPALKRSIPVNTQYELPIRIQYKK